MLNILFSLSDSGINVNLPHCSQQSISPRHSVEIINGKVATWYDISGNNYHLTQNIESKRPTQNVSILNNLPVLSFDGNDYLRVDFPSPYTQPCTIFTIWKTNASNEQTLIDNLAYPNHFLANLS